nr:hypothetical protein [Tanacetum cinerariifolium]
PSFSGELSDELPNHSHHNPHLHAATSSQDPPSTSFLHHRNPTVAAPSPPNTTLPSTAGTTTLYPSSSRHHHHLQPITIVTPSATLPPTIDPLPHSSPDHPTTSPSSPAGCHLSPTTVIRCIWIC